MNRVIGEYQGNEKGPLIICLGAMHGNEPAGIKAIDLVLKLLEVEPIKNPTFSYKGKFIGLLGNKKAYIENKRFIQRDLNRQFKSDKIKHLKTVAPLDRKDEDNELIEIIETIEKEVKTYQPTQLIILDLHTTSSKGGIFTICQNEVSSINLAQALHAPVVLGMLKGLQGTTLHYFIKENMGVDTIALTFESGQHEEPLSINRAIAGILCCMREIGSVKKSDVDNLHEKRLIEDTNALPKITTLVERFPIEENDTFKMLPGFQNFDIVNKHQLLATNNNKEVLASHSGRILMPLYQTQGEDGFFIVKEI